VRRDPGAGRLQRAEHASPDIREVVVQHGGYEISTAKCELLNRHNLRLAVTGEAAVLSDVSIGWATVRLISSGNVVSSQVQTSTYVNRFAGSSEVAGELLVRAINDAVAGLDFELAARRSSARWPAASRPAPVPVCCTRKR
jgi:hypothetical protein